MLTKEHYVVSGHVKMDNTANDNLSAVVQDAAGSQKHYWNIM